MCQGIKHQLGKKLVWNLTMIDSGNQNNNKIFMNTIRTRTRGKRKTLLLGKYKCTKKIIYLPINTFIEIRLKYVLGIYVNNQLTLVDLFLCAWVILLSFLSKKSCFENT
jgi:hypothetical protein